MISNQADVALRANADLYLSLYLVEALGLVCTNADLYLSLPAH